MNKKTKKRLELVQQRLQRLRQQLAGARKQMDEPGEVERIQTEIAAAEEELGRLKAEK